MTRGNSAFGKLARELVESLDVLIDVEKAELDESGKPTIVGRVTKNRDGSCYELKLTQIKAADVVGDDEISTATLSKAQREVVDKARASRKRPRG